MSRHVALFGGSFNPPHVGHLLVATYVRSVLELDAIWIMPVGSHPFGKELAPFQDRVALCAALAGLIPGAEVTEVDGEPGLDGRTIHTVERLRARLPDTEFSLILGADTAADWGKWFEFDRLVTLVRPIVVGRRGHGMGKPPFPGVFLDEVEMPPVSSTEVRARLVRDEDISGLVPRSVIAEIRRRGLYR
jgi:nicotinate-nucleotide adenylyltransferase